MPSETLLKDDASTTVSHGDATPTARLDTSRLEWIDLLKGIGIVLVVAGHALGGLIDAGVTPEGDWFRPLFAGIYVFHMPLFFFLTGLFVTRRVQSDPGRFRAQLFAQILWAYFLWATIQTVAIDLAGDLANRPGAPLGTALLRIFYLPPSQFWFLYGLFFLHGLSLLLGRRVSDPFYCILLFAAASLAEWQQLPPTLRAIMQMAPYYGLGVFLGPRLLSDARSIGSGVWLWSIPVAIAAWFATMARAVDIGIVGRWPQSAPEIASDVNGFENFYAALAILVALICLARRIGSRAPFWLRLCGERTMPIFVTHIMVIAAARIAILKFQPSVSPGVLLTLLCALGIVLPLIAATVADRLRLSKWLGWR